VGRAVGSRVSKRLTQLAIKAAKKPGYYHDGDGLYLQVSSSSSTSWVQRYTFNGRAREMGLGSTRDWTLPEAREQARKNRQLLQAGIDPAQHRQAERERQRAASAQRRSFAECAREYHELHAPTWKNAKHSAQWINTLQTYVFPVFGNTDISSVNKANILAALEPIWMTKPETASRVRQRLRAVLDWAAARDYRVGHDPHLWDQVASSLPKTAEIKKRKHLAACPYADVAAVLDAIREGGASEVVKAGLEFLVLTAVRSGDVRGALWAEIDWKGKRWVLPPERQKAGREHRVPLCERTLDLLRQRQATGDESPFVFPGRGGRTLSDMAFTEVLRRLGFDFTVHGFRSSFRDWCAEQTTFPREVCEAALAHASANGNDVEASYFRSDLFEKRRLLMAAWADYCASVPAVAQVVTLEQI
jgi:integrase